MVVTMARWRNPLRPLFLALIVADCSPTMEPHRSGARYLVTEDPIDIGMGIRLCVAVDASDEHGVWWWMPGRTGCDSRSSGPGVFHPQDGTVSPLANGARTLLGFRVGTHSGSRPFIDVRLVVEHDEMTAAESGDRVHLNLRDNLTLPEWP